MRRGGEGMYQPPGELYILATLRVNRPGDEKSKRTCPRLLRGMSYKVSALRMLVLQVILRCRRARVCFRHIRSIVIESCVAIPLTSTIMLHHTNSVVARPIQLTEVPSSE